MQNSSRKWLAGILFAGFLSFGGLVRVTGAREPSSTSVSFEKERAAQHSTIEQKDPETPREFFNAGTRLLQQSNLWRAEYCFEHVLASQEDRFQQPALYNLGHVRFDSGLDELKKGPPAAGAASHGRASAQQADNAINGADAALADNGIDKLVAAYLQGRGAQKDLKAATKAVKQALDACGKTLKKWERSEGDFRSAVELKPGDNDAARNAEVVDQCIAKLVDSIRQLQQMAQAMGNQSKNLGEKIKQLKGRIPADQMPPGAAGDSDEEEDMPFGKDPTQKDAPSRDGEKIPISPEQAEWLLDAFGSGRLLMTQEGNKDLKRKPQEPW